VKLDYLQMPFINILDYRTYNGSLNMYRLVKYILASKLPKNNIKDVNYDLHYIIVALKRKEMAETRGFEPPIRVLAPMLP
jgi:hypothetical protein